MVSVALFTSAMLAGCIERPALPVTPELKLVEVVDLPTRLVDTDALVDAWARNELILLDGGDDELPGGPQGFDVLENRSFVVADPLRKRLAFFDSTGSYLASCPLGFPVTSVTRVGNQFEVRDLQSGDWYRARLLEGLGQSECIVEEAPPESIGLRSAEEGGEATLDRSARNVGTIDWTLGARADRTPLEVTYESDSTRMVSLQGVGPVSGAARGLGDELMVVAIEAATPAETIQLRKDVRVYDESNRLVAAVSDVPIDYFIPPVNEFRVLGTRLYQLYVKRDGVRIKIWSFEDER
jgi:hypothetical protein